MFNYLIHSQQLQFFHKLIRHIFLLSLCWRLEGDDDDTYDDDDDDDDDDINIAIDDEVRGGRGSDGDDSQWISDTSFSESVSELTKACQSVNKSVI